MVDINDLKDLTAQHAILGGLVILGLVVLAMKRILNIFGLDIVRKNGSGTPPDQGAAHPISPEALSKINAITKDLRESYLTREKHGDLCKIACLEMKRYISRVLEEHTDKVIAAIKAK